MIEVSVSDVLEALRAYSQRPEGGEGVRVEELCKLSGYSPITVRKAIAKGLEAGAIVRTKRLINRLDGRVTTVTAYKNVFPTKKRKKT